MRVEYYEATIPMQVRVYICLQYLYCVRYQEEGVMHSADLIYQKDSNFYEFGF